MGRSGRGKILREIWLPGGQAARGYLHPRGASCPGGKINRYTGPGNWGLPLIVFPGPGPDYTSSYSFKLESDCKFCNEVTSLCDHHVTFVRLSDWSSDLTSYFTRAYCQTTHQWKYIKVNITFNAEVILRYCLNKIAFDDKLKVSCPASVDNYLIWLHCFETNMSQGLTLTQCEWILYESCHKFFIKATQILYAI